MLSTLLTRYLLLVSFGLILLDSTILASLVEHTCYLLAWLSYQINHLFNDAIILQTKDILRYAPAGFAVLVGAECSGLHSIWITSAFMLLYPTNYQYKIIGITTTIIILQLINIIRLLSLVYIGQWQPDWFHNVHYYLYPAFFHLASLLILITWASQLPTLPPHAKS